MDSARSSTSLAPARRVAFGVVTAIAALLGVELVLQLASLTVPAARDVLSVGIPLVVEDPELGHRLNPRVPDHDESGWRNEHRLENSDVVALGDSQTYGQIVAREEAWPQRLGSLTGLRVYNMGVPGHGPVDYYALLAEAKRLRPRWVLVGLYSGNDFYGAYGAVYRRGRLPELRSQDETVLAALERAEAERGDLLEAWSATRRARQTFWSRWSGRWLDPIRLHSRLWGLGRAVNRAIGSGGTPAGARGDRIEPLAAREYAGADPGVLMPLAAGGIETVLTPSQRLGVLDTGDPRIAEGVRVTQELLVRMAEECGSDCELIVVLLPTKELVFESVASGSSQPIPFELKNLLEFERAIWDSIRAELDTREIRWVDTLPALRRAIEAGQNPFPGDWNGHLNAHGNEVVARAIGDAAADSIHRVRPDRGAEGPAE